MTSDERRFFLEILVLVEEVVDLTYCSDDHDHGIRERKKVREKIEKLRQDLVDL